MQFTRIVLTCVVASVLYGILHDQVTAHICVEYFSVFHSPVFPTESPTLLALGWGVIATWWMRHFSVFFLLLRLVQVHAEKSMLPNSFVRYRNCL